jgi:A/G-specific adenine glycosylase
MVKLPGVGRNTAGALMNYVYERPIPFIETNIRSVYLFYFFATEKSVSDAEIYAKVEETMDREHPREWFWALMDVGTYLKQQGAGGLAISKHYRKQPPLKGSIREVRGQIIAYLTEHDTSSEKELTRALVADERFPKALEGLIKDGLVMKRQGYVHLTKHQSMRDNT